MKYLTIPQRGEYAGEFVISEGDESYSIGDLIEAAPIGEIETKHLLEHDRAMLRVQVSVRVTLSTELEPIEATFCYVMASSRQTLMHFVTCKDIPHQIATYPREAMGQRYYEIVATELEAANEQELPTD